MASCTHRSATPVTPAAFRVSVDAQFARIEATATEVADGLHLPFDRHPEKLPRTTHRAAWRQWFCRSLGITLSRVCELILLIQGMRGFGREWVRASILQPLASLNDDIVIPRPVADQIGTVQCEIAEAALAVGGALLSADREEPLAVRAPKIAAAQRELGDLLEVSR